MTYIGIDPGKHGAFAAIQNNAVVTYFELDKQRMIDELDYLLADNMPIRCCLEQVHAMPKQGSVSMFTFGESYGWLKGVLEAKRIPYQVVSPQTWKKEFNLNSEKEKSIEVCRQLFPDVNLILPGKHKAHDGVAEAILMAEYARRKL